MNLGCAPVKISPSGCLLYPALPEHGSITDMNSEQQPTEIGVHRAYYRLTRERGLRPRLERLTRELSDDAPVRDWYRTHPWPESTQYEVVLRVYVAAGRVFVGTVEVNTIPQPFEGPYGRISPPMVEPLQVGVDIWRLLNVGTLAQEAIEEAKDYDNARMALAERPEVFARLAATTVRGERAKLRPGPQVRYTPEVLTVAAEAYQRGGRTGRAAARRALQDSGLLPGNGPNGEVTDDQAKVAVTKARAAGLIPPTN